MLTIFGKSWDAPRPGSACGPRWISIWLMIEDTVRFLKSQGREVIYDAEHFFDGYRADPEYALATIQAARQGGADLVALATPTGGDCPPKSAKSSAGRRSNLGTAVGIHAHNDCEMGRREHDRRPCRRARYRRREP